MLPEGTCPFRFLMRRSQKQSLAFPNERLGSKFTWQLPDVQRWLHAVPCTAFWLETRLSTPVKPLYEHLVVGSFLLTTHSQAWEPAVSRNVYPGTHLLKAMKCRCLEDIGFGIICVRIRPSSIAQASWSGF